MRIALSPSPSLYSPSKHFLFTAPRQRLLSTMPPPNRRLRQLLSEVRPANLPPSIGTLKLGQISYEVPGTITPTRLPHSGELLDARDLVNLDNLHFMLQKYLLGQDVFLISQPGPYARRLALTFASLINSEYEYISLHRDIGETELKQGREIRAGGNLVYVDSPAVRAVKHGRLLILEGIEKAERGIMPVLNNLLENREMNLEDGTHIVHPHRYAKLDSLDEGTGRLFIPAHKNFRVIAIGAPTPPYPGYPLDPPFRSRFQSRFIDPVGSSMALQSPIASKPSELADKLRDLILTTQYASESRHALEAISQSNLPPFPQTSIVKVRSLLSVFPPPDSFSSGQLARLLLTLHPGLIHAPFAAWAMLERQTVEAGLGELGSPSMSSPDERIGLFGYQLTAIERVTDATARITFESENGSLIVVTAPAGPKPYRPFPFQGQTEFLASNRFIGQLTSFMQAHVLGWDISVIPPVLPSTASSSTSILVKVFGQILGYETEENHMYKEISGRELIMRRTIQDGGATSWEPSNLISGAWSGKLVHLSGLDVIGSTAGSLSRLVQDREIELWEEKRIVAQASDEESASGELSVAHPSFRIISTASKSLPLKDWLSDEHANMWFPIPSQPMDALEEMTILQATGSPSQSNDKKSAWNAILQTLLSFAEKYRDSMTADNAQKNRKLGTRSLVRIAKRLALYPQDSLYALITRSVLSEFIPAVEKMNLHRLLAESGIRKENAKFCPAPFVEDDALVFPASTSATDTAEALPTKIPRFDPASDRDGVASHIPHMDTFFDNNLQTGLMRDLAIDLEILGEHLVLLGNQGVGKNKIVDRLCQLLGRPTEYIQLHRDTTVNQLMFTTELNTGVIKRTDSPLLRAIKVGRVQIIDEADKAPEHVVAIFRSLASHGELTLSDGRRVRPNIAAVEREGDIAVHPDFRLILLANRPGYPFLGNQFLQVLGDNFSCHSVSNPDEDSERKLLQQLAPELDENLIARLVGAFQDLRKGYEVGTLNYPYSLRELINLVRHIRAYPGDSLGEALRNIFDFDIYKHETIDALAAILMKHQFDVPHLGLAAAREATQKSITDLDFTPAKTDLDKPKEGKHDPDNEAHEGGNTWAGGTGGRDTAGLGGIGGYKRLYKGHNIKQVSDEVKTTVPAEVTERARKMAKEELQFRLQELDMTNAEAEGYGELLRATQAHMLSLHDLLENLAAKEEERVWIRRQTDGELDDTRLTEGLTGEASVYKRRGMEKPELGRPQIKPKRIRFVFDLSASMYRFQYDGRLNRSIETAAMLMETFDRLSRKDKYVWDMYGHSGDGPDILLVEAGKPPLTVSDRWKVIEKMAIIPQYAFAGDYTLEAVEIGVKDVAKYDADEWFLIAITDANFQRYQITPDELIRAMNRQAKVHTALICIGEGAEASWITQRLPGRGFRVANTADIPVVLRSVLSTMVDR